MNMYALLADESPRVLSALEESIKFQAEPREVSEQEIVDRINNWDKKNVLYEYLSWEGIIGYDRMILSIMNLPEPKEPKKNTLRFELKKEKGEDDIINIYLNDVGMVEEPIYQDEEGTQEFIMYIFPITPDWANDDLLEYPKEDWSFHDEVTIWNWLILKAREMGYTPESDEVNEDGDHFFSLHIRGEFILSLIGKTFEL